MTTTKKTSRKKFTKAQREEWKAKKRDEVTGLLDKLSAGVAAIQTSDDWRRFLTTQALFHTYSFRNTMLIAMQRPDATRVAGYKTWQKMGRQVRKGERGIRILAPVTRKTEVENDKGEVEEKRSLYFRAVSVFDIAQTDGDPLPTPCTILDGTDVESERASLAFDALSAWSQSALGTPVHVEDIDGGANGFYRRSEGAHSIHVEKSNPSVQRLKTLCHELGHRILHSDLEDIHARKVEEVEAESVAFCVMHALSFDSSGYSFGYVAAWSKGDSKQIEKSAGQIQKATAKILAGFDAETGAHDDVDEDKAERLAA